MTRQITIQHCHRTRNYYTCRHTFHKTKCNQHPECHRTRTADRAKRQASHTRQKYCSVTISFTQVRRYRHHHAQRQHISYHYPLYQIDIYRKNLHIGRQCNAHRIVVHINCDVRQHNGNQQQLSMTPFLYTRNIPALFYLLNLLGIIV